MVSSTQPLPIFPLCALFAPSLVLRALCPWERGLQLLWLFILTFLLASLSSYRLSVVLSTLFHLHTSTPGEYSGVCFFVIVPPSSPPVIILFLLQAREMPVLKFCRSQGVLWPHLVFTAPAFRSSLLAFPPGLWLMP